MMGDKSVASSSSSSADTVSILFPKGPLGITFEWGANRLKVASDVKDGAPDGEQKSTKSVSKSPAGVAGMGAGSKKQKRQAAEILALRRGDALASVNGVDVQSLSFGEVVKLLREAAHQPDGRCNDVFWQLCELPRQHRFNIAVPELALLTTQVSVATIAHEQASIAHLDLRGQVLDTQRQRAATAATS